MNALTLSGHTSGLRPVGFGYDACMRNLTTLALSAAGAVAFATVPATAASDGHAAAFTALQTVRRDATAISAGRYPTKAALQAPAREIALAWSQAADVLGKDASIRVEMKMANDSVTKFEQSWQQADKARATAKDVSTSVADLIDAAKHG